MTKEQFLNELRARLANLPADEINEILRDQDEYIHDAIRAGRTEEQVVNSLGDPKSFAAGLTADLKIQQAQNSKGLKEQTSGIFGAMFAVLALAPLNLFFVLGPFLLVLFLTGIAWIVVAALMAASVAVLFAFIFKMFVIPLGILVHLSTLLFCLGLVGAGFLSLIFMLEFTRYLFKGTLAYLKWNLSFVKSQL